MDLVDHHVISYSYLSYGDEWHFEGPQGPAHVRVSPRFQTNNGDTCRVAALAGQGIILQPDFIVADDLWRGALVELMPGYRATEIGIHAVYPTRKHLPLKLRRLVDFLVARSKDLSHGRAPATPLEGSPGLDPEPRPATPLRRIA